MICWKTIFDIFKYISDRLDKILEKFRRSHPEVFLGKGVLKISADLEEKTHAEVRFQ